MKAFLIKWCIFFCIIFGFAAYYVDVVGNNISGDIGALAKIPFARDYELRIRSLDYTDNLMTELVDVDSLDAYPLLLVGDSFTEPEFALGHNISKAVGDTIRVVNAVWKGNVFAPTEAFVYCLRNHRFHRGQTVILESIGRSVWERFGELSYDSIGRPSDVLPTYSWHENQVKRIQGLVERREHPVTSHEVSLNDILTWLRLRLGYKNPISHNKLTVKMFNHDVYGKDLYYCADDINNCDMSDAHLEVLAASVKTLFELAEREGVRLYILLTPDKFDLYYPYIDSPKHSQPNMLEFIKKVDPKYAGRIINSRDSLRPYLERGELDIVRCNDSHWSVYAAEEMGRKVGERLLRDSFEIHRQQFLGQAPIGASLLP